MNLASMKILLNTVEKAKKFVIIASKNIGDITVKSGSYIVDGKSLLGIFSLDLSTPVEVYISSPINAEVISGLKELTKEDR